MEEVKQYNLVVIGGGPAGMAAALAAKKDGVEDILILERDKYIGGILPQCIHNGFGLEYFGEELTGPEYAYKFIERLQDSNIKVKKGTMVVNITENKEITALNNEDGLLQIKADAIILAMGCRERTRENIKIPGDRPAGIFSAGTAQRYTNIEGYMPGKEVIILGSGDIGLIMARRMKLEGANVKAVLEIMPYSSGLVRNKVQCLDDFDIPLKLKHTITDINGKERVKEVTVAKVDEKMNVIPDTEEVITCDTILLSVGLIPENELSKSMGFSLHSVTGGPIVNEARETEIEGVFACGNVLHVHDLVDWVTKESELAGKSVAKYLTGKRSYRENPIKLEPGKNVSYIVPYKIDFIDFERKRIKLFLRADKPLENVDINIIHDNKILLKYKKDIVTPGEMITVNLPEALIKNKMGKIKISINKREEGDGSVQN